MKYWASSKILLGGLLIFLLIVVIWFPLLFMSFINSAYISNIPVDATFTLSVGGYQVRSISPSYLNNESMRNRLGPFPLHSQFAIRNSQFACDFRTANSEPVRIQCTPTVYHAKISMCSFKKRQHLFPMCYLLY